MKKKILVVDDSPTILAKLNDLLTGLGFDVTSANNGKEAYSYVEKNPFNMIITDLKMPVMDGIEFVKRAKSLSNCKFVPIVMLSSEEDEKNITEARRAGVSTFLKKPIKDAQFTAMVNIVLGSAT